MRKKKQDSPDRVERARACASPLALKAEGTREYWLQVLDLVRSYLRSVDEYKSAEYMVRLAKKSRCHKILGYPTHQSMLDAEGLTLMFKAARAILKFKGNPGITMAQLAKEVGCSVSHAAEVIRKAGLKRLSHKEVIQRDHIKPDGTLHIGGEPASQRAVAKVVGCGDFMVREAMRGNSSTGKTTHPTPSPALRKAQGAFLKLSRAMTKAEAGKIGGEATLDSRVASDRHERTTSGHRCAQALALAKIWSPLE